MSNSQDPFMRLLSGFNNSEDLEAAGSSIEKQFQRRSGRTTKPKRSPQTSTKPKPSPQTTGEDTKKDSKDAKKKKIGAKVAGAVGDFAGAVAAGLLAEGARRQKMGRSGAGFAAAFAQGVSPIVDFGKIMRGKADPGTILGRVGKKAMEDNQRFSVADTAKAAGQAAVEAVTDDEPVNPLDLQPEKGDAGDDDADDKVIESAKAAVEEATKPTDPLGDVTDFDRRMVITLGLGGESLTDEQIMYGINTLTNRYGAVKAGNMVRHVMENPQQFTTGSVEQ